MRSVSIRNVQRILCQSISIFHSYRLQCIESVELRRTGELVIRFTNSVVREWMEKLSQGLGHNQA